MNVEPGTRLGPYEVLSAIGAGGMGEVYKARDTRLDRVIAVKVLPSDLAGRSELRERFEREAKTIASLNHPHICLLHDIGHQDGTDFLVMEYLEGETLAARLLKGPLPLDQVLRYSIEIADALDKAHRKGVTHRDIKPGNIMLTKNGTKLLDFGLAKLEEAAAPAESVSQMPTLSHNATAQGTLLGTVQYMAPEQVEGKNDEVDARTDIFAFGAVVYEMATGQKAFQGTSTASMFAKILEHDPPPISSLQPMTPPALDRLVKRCLAKEPDGRWQSAGDTAHELKWIAEGGSEAEIPAARGVRASRRLALVSSIAALVLGAVVASVAVWELKPTPSQPVTRTVITLPTRDRLTFGGQEQLGIAFSPDGSQLAYIANRSGMEQIYVRKMDSVEGKPIPGTDRGSGPFFSPDGQWLGFFADGKLKKISVNGGEALSLADAALPRGGSWSSRGAMIFAPGAGVLQQVFEAGGAPQAATRLERGAITHGWPEFLPGGRAVLFTASTTVSNWMTSQIVVQSLETGGQRVLVQGGTQPRYIPSGHLLYAQGGNLMAVPFDLQRLEVTGTAVPVAEGVLQSTTTGAAQYSVSANGTLAYVAGGLQGLQNRLVWVSRSGAEQALDAPARSYVAPRISPDSRRVAAEPDGQIWLHDLARKTQTRLTFEGNANVRPVWTPDGKRIVFASDKEGTQNLFWQLADGGGGLERLSSSAYLQVGGSFSPDGQFLAYYEVNPTTQRDIAVLRLSDRKSQIFLRTRFNESAPQFSPDGRWLAYASDESSRSEIYVQPYPGPGGKWQISTEGGAEPLWNRSGRELFYRNGDKMMAVEITTQPSFTVGTPQMLFEGRYATSVMVPSYDVSADGQRFLMLKPDEQAAGQINIVQNWFAELKRRVSGGTK